MKLYFSPGACSMAPHIVARETGLPFTVERVDLTKHKTETGIDFTTINPKGYVPALRLDDGQVLTEVPAIMQYLADKAPEKALVPPAGTFDRYRVVEWLNFIGTEIHKSYRPIFRGSDAAKTDARQRLLQCYTYVASQLEGKDHLVGTRYSIADVYLFVTLCWVPHAALDLSGLPVLDAFARRIGNRPAVQETQKAEGLAK